VCVCVCVGFNADATPHSNSSRRPHTHLRDFEAFTIFQDPKEPFFLRVIMYGAMQTDKISYMYGYGFGGTVRRPQHPGPEGTEGSQW